MITWITSILNIVWMHNSLLAGTSLRNYWLEFVTFILHKIEIC